MKVYFLAPPNGENWLSPNDVADRFRDAFARVDVSAEAAQKQGAELLAKYRLLLESGLGNSQSTSIDELEKRWTDALSIAVVIDDDAEEWFRTIACFNHRLQLYFGPSVSGRKRRSIAQRAATALGYVLQSIDGD